MSILKRNFINSIVNELLTLNGTEFEYFCKPLLELIIKDNVLHKGHNLCAKPVGYTTDFQSCNYSIIGQCGTDLNYFEKLEKPMSDISSVIKNNPQSSEIYLFSNIRGSGKELSDLDAEIKKITCTQLVHVFDSERIAQFAYQNVFVTKLFEEILEKLPITKELYKILPETNQIPLLKNSYHSRDEEFEICECLKTNSFIQIFGISGIGKTDLSIKVSEIIRSDYETTIWLDGDAIAKSRIDFNAIVIERFKSNINLSSILQRFKTLIVVDNMNYNVNSFITEFNEKNKCNSKCIITSLQLDVNPDNSINLQFADFELTKKILENAQVKPSDENAERIFKCIGGYPLILSLIVNSVDNREFEWDEICKELPNAMKFTDENGKMIADRIIGKYIQTYQSEMSILAEIDNCKVSKDFYDFAVGKIVSKALEKRAVFKANSIYYYSIHRIILDSIKQLVKCATENSNIYQRLEEYLEANNEIRSVEFRKFMTMHGQYVMNYYIQLSYADSLKKSLLYAIIQNSDQMTNYEWNKSEIDKLTIDPSKEYYDLLLYVERIENSLINHPGEKSDFIDKCKCDISEMQKIFDEVNDDKFKIVLLHHIGKIYKRIDDFVNAKDLFHQVLKIDNSADYARLQLARILLKEGNINEAKETISYVLDSPNERQSITILLSFYELLADKELDDLRKKYINDSQSQFLKVLLYSIDEGFDQPYLVIDKLSGYLSYKQKEMFREIVEAMPCPSNIDSSVKLKKSYATIYWAFYKNLKYSQSAINNKDELLKNVFNTCEYYYLSAGVKSDFERRKLIDIYLQAGEHEKAMACIVEFENSNDPFVLQTISKVYRANGKFDDALASINMAIKTGGDGLKDFYKSAFYNDKAEALFGLKNKECINVLQIARRTLAPSATPNISIRVLHGKKLPAFIRI